MTVLYHPEFVRDIQRFANQYSDISQKLGTLFRQDVDVALAAVKANPTGAGHFINTGSLILREVRRRNLGVFPFLCCTAWPMTSWFLALSSPVLQIH